MLFKIAPIGLIMIASRIKYSYIVYKLFTIMTTLEEAKEQLLSQIELELCRIYDAGSKAPAEGVLRPNL